MSCIENLSHLHAYTCTYIEQVVAKRLEQRNKIVCPTNRYMFTNLLGFDDFMSRLASRLAVSFSFWIGEGMGGYLKYPKAPGVWEVMAEF